MISPKNTFSGILIHSDQLFINNHVCAVLFDGPVLEQALPGDGSLGPLMALGVEEINLFENVHQIIRASPGKSEGLIEKFRQILKEEKKEELICNQCPGGVRALHKRGVGLRRKLAKKKKASKEKEIHAKRLVRPALLSHTHF